MKKIAFCFLLFTFNLFAQKEANIWYFGKNAGLDFNSGVPVALTDGQLNTEEGCASIANNAGQLLFYTDGVTVYNRNHQIMQNGTGLMGNSSTTQSATIIPKPGTSNLYYIFTIDVQGQSKGLRYSIVNMNLDNGLGEVTAEKNIPLYSPTCEKIAITKHYNGIDYWIITHGYGDNKFYAYRLTTTGVSTSPIISSTGIVVDTSMAYNTMGYMKISPNGRKISICHQFLYTCQLLDFDSQTGVVSNPLTIIENDLGQLYGTEFSPNSEILYVTAAVSGNLYQFDLNSNDIISSKKIIHNFSESIGALQLGPDKKIYLTVYGKNKISVINFPDIIGSGCDLKVNTIDLKGRISTAGFPAFNQSFFFNPEIEFKNACVGQNVSFTFATNQTITNAVWDFGDGSPNQNSITGNHIYSTPGTYTVSVTATNDLGVTGTKTRTITIYTVPTASTPQDILVCDNNNDGLYEFDLTSTSNAILNGQDANQFLIKYYASAADYSNNLPITTPSKYINPVAYQQQTIIAEVYNKDNGECKATTTFNTDVFDSPKPQTNVTPFTSCDNTSFGTDTDGRIRFNLTQKNTEILNGQSNSQFTISYFKDAGLTNAIATPANYVNTNSTETIYVKVSNVDHANCFATTSFSLQVFSLPAITSVVSLKQCDDNIDGFSVFNLTEANSKIAANYQNETFTYYQSAIEAQNGTNAIATPTAYTNQTVSNDVVYVRVVNANGCFRVAQLNLNVSTTQIPATFTRSFTVCDDAVSGTNTDGIASFDFSTVTTQIQNIFPVGQQLDITYYRNLADALAEQNAIADISNYRNIGYPNTQKIYIRVDSKVNNDCLGLGQHITLNVERIPIVQPKVYTHCDDDQDGKFAFNTATLQSELLNGLTNVSVSYFDQNDNPLPSPLPNPFVTSSQTLRAVVKNNTPTGCQYETTIQFIVDDLPEAFPISAALTTVCDDEANPVIQDGKFAFDTSTFHSTILGNQTGMTVNYYDQNNKPLPSPLPNPFVTATQNVRVEVINPINTSCTASRIIPFVVHPVPKINLSGYEIVCNAQTITKTLDAGLVDNTPTTAYTYVWKKDGTVLPNESNYTLNINQEGLYTVEVTNTYGCSRTRTMEVTASDLATIDNVQVTDLSNHNSITITVSGDGNYVYSLDNIDYQASNTFSSIPAGIYTVYVKDLNGCGISAKEVSVLGIPAFFTPNGDGYHDYWNIQGMSTTIHANTKILIFDRFNKLLKELNPHSQGWDGTYLDNPLPANDYWYTIQLGDGRLLKGHFSLKR